MFKIETTQKTALMTGLTMRQSKLDAGLKLNNLKSICQQKKAKLNSFFSRFTFNC